MPRAFNGSSDSLLLNAGGCAFTGDITLAGIVRRVTRAGSSSITGADTVGSTGFWEFYCQSSGSGTPNQLTYSSQSGTSVAVTLALVTADVWCFVAVTKATGTTKPRFHKYSYTTGTWAHEDGANSIAGNSGTNATAIIGDSGGDYFQGDIELVGVWNNAMTDAQVESLAFSLPAWFQFAPKALWKLDQSATTQNVLDISGLGATQNTLTGTTVATSSVPVFNYGTGVWTPTWFVAAPTNVTPAAVTGNVVVGQILTAAPGVWTGADTVTGKWQNSATSGGVYADIASATATTYTVVAGDLTKYIRYLETATDSGGSTTQASNVVGPVTAAPSGGQGQDIAPIFFAILADF